ncbi:type VII secretion protein EssB/YukC [Terrilactibacillus sp. S3-3]|nr:type VII secretion protein EssB/YukC [Terrilactibacillus sp. S3-3]
MKQEDRRHTLVFQRAKIPLRHVEELGVLQSINDGISRQVETTEDEIIITAQADPELQPFFKLNNEPYIEKLIFAGNLVHFFETDTYSRIIPICFPENLYFSAGLEPVFSSLWRERQFASN